VFNYFLGPRASVELPSEAFLAVYNGVYVPWNGGTGRLMVNRPMLGKSTTITVNSQTVASVPKATVADPWIETVFAEAEPSQLVVVQVQSAPQRFGILVFVDGSCLQGGGSLDEWRAKKPARKDNYEERMQPDGRAWSKRTAVALGALIVLPGLALIVKEPTNLVYWVGIAGVFLAIVGWWLLIGRFVRWLQTKRTWPWGLRVFSVPTVALGLPVLVILTLQALAQAK
jgi:hypothetical protein